MIKLTGGLIMAAAVTATAQAQTAGMGNNDGSAPQVEEIIVTAQKREQSLQKVPVAVTALSGETLENRNIQNIEGLMTSVPSLRYQEFQGNGLLTLRGVGSDNVTVGGDPAVAFHVNGIYYARTTSAEGLFYDVARIEVLRGPQGTLYGRNATGGSVNVIINKPDYSGTDIFGDLTVGNYDRIRARGVINVPIVNDKAALRISAIRDMHDGYQKNLATNNPNTDSDDADIFELRGQLGIMLSDTVDVILRTTYASRGGNGPAEKALGAYRPLIVANPAPPPSIFALSYTDAPPFGYGARPNPSDLRRIYLNGPNKLDVDTINFNGEMNIALPESLLGGASIKTILAYQDQDFNFMRDSDMSEAEILYSNFIHETAKQTSAEIQLISSPSARNQWIVGAYYLGETGKTDISIAYGPVPPGLTALTIPLATALSIDSRSYAVYGQYTAAFSDVLRATLGLRYSNDRKIADSVAAFGGPPITFGGRKSWSAVTGKFGLDWTLAEGRLLYASVSRGYKAGGFTLAQAAPYNPEYLWAYEAGAKLDILDRRLRLNLAGFYYDYTDLQVSSLAAGPGGVPTLVVGNAAASSVKGVELEMIATPAQGWTIDGSVSYLNSKYTNYVTIDDANPGAGLVDLSGNRLPNAPRWSISLGIQKSVNLRSGKLTGSVRTYWSARQSLTPFARPATDYQGEFTKTDASIKWDAPGDRWGIEAYVQNIENKDVINRVSYVQLLNNYRVSVNPPRKFGIKVSAKY